jgi:hypothetical protein
MNKEKAQGEALYIKWGRFEAGANGRSAVFLLAILVAVALIWFAFK